MTQTNDTSINIFMSLVQHVYISCNDYIITFTYTRLLKYLMMTQLKISKPLIYKISHAQRAWPFHYGVSEVFDMFIFIVIIGSYMSKLETHESKLET